MLRFTFICENNVKHIVQLPIFVKYVKCINALIFVSTDAYSLLLVFSAREQCHAYSCLYTLSHTQSRRVTLGLLSSFLVGLFRVHCNWCS